MSLALFWARKCQRSIFDTEKDGQFSGFPLHKITKPPSLSKLARGFTGPVVKTSVTSPRITTHVWIHLGRATIPAACHEVDKCYAGVGPQGNL